MTAREIYTQLVGAGFKRLPVPKDDDGKEDEEAAVWLHRGRLNLLYNDNTITDWYHWPAQHRRTIR